MPLEPPSRRLVLPPGQQLAAPGKWPVVGEHQPATRTDPWRVTVTGLVARPQSWTLAELLTFPLQEREIDIHCVTRWSQLGLRFRGVLLADLLACCQPLPTARYISFVARSVRRHSTSLPLEDALALGTLVAFSCNGQPLEECHGGPVRTVVPGRYFYKSLKWLETVELLAEDRLGYWEAQAGYHNRADVWRQERYLAPTLDRRQARELLARREVRGWDLRGLEAAGLDLRGLLAQGALLRDAHFERACLDYAHLQGANLTNAHLQGASLRGADLRGADLSGANLCGADLCGADLSGAVLLATTFTPEPGESTPWGPARCDAATRWDGTTTEQLTPEQQAFVLRVQELARSGASTASL
jgi:DMSO/TMAO reductase YedYZ molybdopterin-dependent catalytic subunit